LAAEVKNSAKLMVVSFNTNAVFLHDVMVSEMTFLRGVVQLVGIG